MCEDVQQLLDHAEVLAIGNASREAALALAAIGPDRILVDLTRGVVRPHSASGPASAVPSLPPAESHLAPAVQIFTAPDPEAQDGTGARSRRITAQ